MTIEMKCIWGRGLRELSAVTGIAELKVKNWPRPIEEDVYYRVTIERVEPETAPDPAGVLVNCQE